MTADGNEIELISDGDGLTVVGEPEAVEKFLRKADQWAAAKELDLSQALSLGSKAAGVGSEIAANSAYWVKLTPESARLVRENGLMRSKTTGQSHLMVGVPGRVQNWLQTEQRVGSILTNPATLSGVSGLMAQAALQQAIADITAYLKSIDVKVDDVLRKVDDTVVAQLVGAGHAIERALTIREETGTVNETLWSTVDQTHQTIGTTQTYALDQLKVVAAHLEGTSVGELFDAASLAEREVPKWLAVLGRCVQLQDAVDVIELDRVMAESPQEIDAYRRGLKKAQSNHRELVSERTADLLDRLEHAANTANAKLVWSRTKSLEIVSAANQLSSNIDDFHGLLTIEMAPRSWGRRELSRTAEITSQAIQQTKDKGPAVAGGVAATVALALVAMGRGGGDSGGKA